MRRSALRNVTWLAIALLTALSLVAPAAAGGWATVELDEPVVRVPVGQPLTIGFTILQHGVTPVEGATPYLTATHRGTATELRADGVADGEIGQYVVEVTFPLAGEWKWGITPDPFPQPTMFPVVTALTAGQLAANPDLPAVPEEEIVHPAAVVRGGCGAPGETRFDLTGVAPLAAPAAAAHDTPVVKESATTLPIALADLLSGDHAIVVQRGDAAGPAACGAIVGQSVDEQGEVIVGLSEDGDSGYVGFARLAEVDGATTVTIYLSQDLSAPAAIEIDISDLGFSPTSLTVAAGQTVTWTNRGAVVHTVTAEDLDFDDSGTLHPGDSFSQTFDSPGTYAYRCGPHPGMVGTIVVT